MAEEAVGTWDRLWNLLTEDDRARWKLISWTILGSGTIGAVDLALFDSGVEDTTILMCFAVLVMALFGTGWYCVFGRLPQRDQERLPRRRLVFQFSLGLLAVLLSASLSTVQARILNSELEHATAAQNLPDVAGILNRAQNANVRLKQPSMDVIRRRLLMMNSADAPGAWDALLAYASYATTVRKAPSVGSTKMPTGARWSFQVPIDDPDWEKKISISPYQAPAGSFALFQPITTIQNDDLPLGPAWLIIRNATVPVDGWHLRSVICIGCTIVYSGTPVVLENVYCEKCKFAVQENNEGVPVRKGSAPAGNRADELQVLE